MVLRLSSAAARREAMRVYRDLYKKEALMDGNRLLLSSERLYHDLTETKPAFACAHCKNHFLRGVMIATATLTDPKKTYRLEFRLQDAENLPYLNDLLCGEGWHFNHRIIPGGVALYTGKSEWIENILAFAGAGQSVFESMNAKIEKEIRNAENRATNCVTHNIVSTVRASARSREAIELIKKRGKLQSLPQELRQTALLRLENPEASLVNLARMHTPPITKSGLNHRLEKLMEIACELREGE